MFKNKIISNLNYKCCGCSTLFKDVTMINMNFHYDKILNRRILYHIINLDEWFESNFKKGEKLEVQRVSENSKYDFNSEWWCY